jgi:hypothetical protein
MHTEGRRFEERHHAQQQPSLVCEMLISRVIWLSGRRNLDRLMSGAMCAVRDRQRKWILHETQRVGTTTGTRCRFGSAFIV